MLLNVVEAAEVIETCHIKTICVIIYFICCMFV